jgi:dTDP-4-amino-4,6-dideoxygalactose transaminase
MNIPLSKQYLTGNEISYLAQLFADGEISSDGEFSHRCATFLEQKYSIGKVLLTPSCTSALELACLLCNIGPNDEVILPSFTFSSTANAFVRAGAVPVFVDIRADTLNIDEEMVEAVVTEQTKAICPVHYAGVPCEMDRLAGLAAIYDLAVIEDAAQGLNSFYDGKALGSIGTAGAYSFHSTKNQSCGEGGALCVNSASLIERAEIIRDKGTNRAKFIRGEVDKYTWVDVGSSFIPSELTSAVLLAQLEMTEVATRRREKVHEFYDYHFRSLQDQGLLRLPIVPPGCRSNYHIYYILVADTRTRDALRKHLNENGIRASSHYVPLHSSPMGQSFGYRAGTLPVTEDLSGRLLRLPIYPELSEYEQMFVIRNVRAFLHKAQFREVSSSRLIGVR